MVTFVEGFTSLYLLCMCNTGFLNKGRVAKKRRPSLNSIWQIQANMGNKHCSMLELFGSQKENSLNR